MRTYSQYCSMARGLDLIGDRWTLLIVRELLSMGECRYVDLQRGLPGIATNLLAGRLREMEESGLIRRRELPRPASSTVFSLTPRGAALEGVAREFVKWGAGLMSPPTADETFRAHWLLLPLRALCRDNDPGAPDQVIRVGDVADGCDIIAESGSVRVEPSSPDRDPVATVTGDPGATVAMFAGQLPVDAARGLIRGDIDAVHRIVGGMPSVIAVAS